MSAATPVVAGAPPRHPSLDGAGPGAAASGVAAAATSRWLGWLALAVAGAPAVEAVRILVQRSHVVLYGDQALLELATRRAAHFDQLVGPYSREGFHDPGPAVFYLLAPFVRILEPAGPGLYLGAVAISGAALIATVAFVWRRFDPLTALWAAAALDLYCLCLRVGTLREPWNPYLVAAPMVLFVVLWAGGITGSSGAAVWAIVVGSYEVQTYIATAGFVVIMLLILGVWLTRSAWQGRTRGTDRTDRSDRTRLAWLAWLGRLARLARREIWRPAGMAGAVALVLIWLAPVIELWRDRPNNLQLLWDFFTAPHSTPPLHQSVQVVADSITIMPFGNQDYATGLPRSDVELGIGAALIVIGLVAALVLGWRRRQPTSLALAAGSVLGMVLGTVSLWQSAGPLFIRYAVWLAFVPLTLLLAIGVALLAPAAASLHNPGRIDRHRPAWSLAGRGRPIVALCVTAAVVAGALTIQSDLRMVPITATTGAGPWPSGNAGTPQGRLRTVQDTLALSQAAEQVLRPTDRWVGLTIGTSSLWPYAAGIVLELDEHGVQSTVAPASWELYFGHERAPGRSVEVVFDLYSSSDIAANNPVNGRVIANIHGEVLTYQRT